MGKAISYILLNLNGTVAKYGYANGFDDFNGVFELDLSRHEVEEITCENKNDILFDIITPCVGERKDYGLAGRVFMRIHRHCKEHGDYPEKGGHYSG